MGEMEFTERFHVYPEPSGPHNEREPELIANENKANSLRWIDPHGHEAWAGNGAEAMGLREAYEFLFGPAIERYNKDQKRKDRKKTVEGYMQEVREDGRGRKNKAIADANERAKAKGRPQDVRKDQGKHESYEVILSLGNVRNRVPEGVAKEIYQRYVEEWPKRNPNFYLYRVDYAPSFSVLIPICRVLECSIDWLLTGSAFGAPKAGPESSCDDVPLSQLELDLVAMFRHLKEHDRKNAFDFVALLYEQGEGKADSAYSTYPNEDSKQTIRTPKSNGGIA